MQEQHRRSKATTSVVVVVSILMITLVVMMITTSFKEKHDEGWMDDGWRVSNIVIKFIFFFYTRL